MLASEAIARIPRDVALWGGVASGIGATYAVGSTLTDHGVGSKDVALLGVGGGMALAAFGTGAVDAVAKLHGPIVDRFAVNGLEQVARTTTELRWGIAGSRIVSALTGAGLGAFIAGSGYATSN